MQYGRGNEASPSLDEDGKYVSDRDVSDGTVLGTASPSSDNIRTEKTGASKHPVGSK